MSFIWAYLDDLRGRIIVEAVGIVSWPLVKSSYINSSIKQPSQTSSPLSLAAGAAGGRSRNLIGLWLDFSRSCVGIRRTCYLVEDHGTFWIVYGSANAFKTVFSTPFRGSNFDLASVFEKSC